MAAAPESASWTTAHRRGPSDGAGLGYAFALDVFASLLASGLATRRWRAEGAPLSRREVVTVLLVAPEAYEWLRSPRSADASAQSCSSGTFASGCWADKGNG